MSSPRVAGFTHVSLSVSDLERSLAFYRDVLHLPVLREPFDGSVFDGREAMVLTGRSALCLQAHASNQGEAFDPRRTGLDHPAFRVGTVKELHDLVDRLDEAGVEHSGVKPLPGFGHFIEPRDPDGIQLELHAMPAEAG